MESKYHMTRNDYEDLERKRDYYLARKHLLSP